MENRIRLLFVIAALGALSGCSLFRFGEEPAPEPEAEPAQASTDDPADRPIIEPEVERRAIKRAKIDNENFEIGAYIGALSIEDFGTQVVSGGRLAYHLSEDFFLEATLGQTKASKTSYERLAGSVTLLTDEERNYRYYGLSAGWNALPGEIFLGRNRAYNSSFYLVAGIGGTTFGGDDLFTLNGGFGYRVLPADWMAIHFDVRDYIYSSDLLGENKISSNLEAHLGLTVFF